MKEEKGISRRGFLKTAAAIGAALSINPVLDKIHAAETAMSGNNPANVKTEGMQYRILGSGETAMEVSALGFGVMGLPYQNPQHKSEYRIAED